LSTLLSIHSLELWTRIGVFKEERRSLQRILVTIRFEGAWARAGTTDEIGDTVDYERVYREIRFLAKEERKTLEKLAEDIAAKVLEEKRIQKVTVELQKFILPGTSAVSITITRP
jgi:FolB domain-containing protein